MQYFTAKPLGTAGNGLAKWNIKINNDIVTTGAAYEFTMNTFNVEESSKVVRGKFAPSSRGWFNIYIDPSNTQVSIKYDITVDTSMTGNSKIKLVSITKANGTNTIVKTGTSTYTGVIPLSSINGSYVEDVKIIIEWENDTANNLVDTRNGNG